METKQVHDHTIATADSNNLVKLLLYTCNNSKDNGLCVSVVITGVQ